MSLADPVLVTVPLVNMCIPVFTLIHVRLPHDSLICGEKIRELSVIPTRI